MNHSLRSKLFFFILKATNFKERVEKKAFKQITDYEKKFPPNNIKRYFKFILQNTNGHALVTYESKKELTDKHIIFLHGGAYIFKTFKAHWRLSQKIVRETSCRITHLDYPLAPEYNYRDTFKMLSGAYDLLTSQYPDDKFMFMGDSAGGGLGLAFAQKLIKEKHPKLPAKIILLSPWLDISLSNPEVKKQEDSDHILSLKMLKYAAMKYSNGEDQHQYLLSPIYGDLTKLPPAMVFFGTEELFCADCKMFKSLINSHDHNIIFRKYHKMQHDWGIFPIPERKKLINEVCDFIKA
jgi:acetyl esterase/lipase